MALIDSRLGRGTLTLGTGGGYEAQITNVRLVPEVDSSDPEPTLDNIDPTPDETTTWKLAGDAIQDWQDADGFVRFCLANAGADVPFVWTPSTTLGTTFSGTCKVRAVEIGGDVKVRNKSAFEFAVSGLSVSDNLAP
jgi:hypothetical protein